MTGSRPTDALERWAGDALLVRRFRLRVLAGPDAGLVHDGAGPHLTIGTHRSADFKLNDPTMSRFHCEVRLAGGRALVRDLGSKNGTAIGGVAIESGYVADRQTLELGQTRIRFETGSDEVRVPLSPRDRFGRLVGRSPAMRQLFDLLERVAPTAATVLLQGETGTGKDLAAESIHQASDRREGPLVAIQCGAIPARLLESELFGHERGAFTGADRARRGAFEQARGGTLFLDEIGELPLDLQPVLLRALANRCIQRIGGSRPIDVDLRVIAATNRDLKREVNARRFRSDLYYRLAVVGLTVPPLRERREDIPLLCDAILTDLGASDRPEARSLRAPAIQDALARHDWPGNVRELRNHVQRVLVAAAHPAPDERWSSRVVSVSVHPDLPFAVARERCLEAFERAYVEELLRRHGGNASQAARAAGLARSQLYVVLGRRGLR